jgi:hypothetical protein
MGIGVATGLAFEVLFAALGYLTSGVVGMAMAPHAVAVNLPLFGYALKVFRGGLAGEEGRLPEWDGWGGLVLSGFLLALVGVGYGLVPLLMILGGLNLLVRGGALLFMASALIVLGLFVAVSVSFFLPMGVARYLVEERLEVAFRPDLLWAIIARAPGEYVATYAGALGLLLLGGLVASIPAIGAIAAPVLAFYLSVVLARLFGEVCGHALRLPAPATAAMPPAPPPA